MAWSKHLGMLRELRKAREFCALFLTRTTFPSVCIRPSKHGNHKVIIMISLCWCNVLRWIWCLWCYSAWVYIHTGQAWKICLTTVGIEPTTFGILAQCSGQLSYAVWSVRVCDISEQNLVPSISMLSNNNNHDFSVLVQYFSSLPGVDIHSE